MAKGRATDHYYEVEIRTSFNEPQTHSWGFIVDSVWRRIPVVVSESEDLSRIQVNLYNAKARELRLLDYPAAYAYACLALTQPNYKGLCFQARLVKVKLETWYNTEKIGATEPISLSDLSRAAKFTPLESNSGLKTKG